MVLPPLKNEGYQRLLLIWLIFVIQLNVRTYLFGPLSHLLTGDFPKRSTVSNCASLRETVRCSITLTTALFG